MTRRTAVMRGDRRTSSQSVPRKDGHTTQEAPFQVYRLAAFWNCRVVCRRRFLGLWPRHALFREAEQGENVLNMRKMT